jgi:hypothetical protein
MKQNHPILSIDPGMQIDFNDEQPENANSPRIESLEPDSKVTVER